VAGVSPVAGPVTGGTLITVTGTGFVPGATVTLGGRPAREVTVVDAHTITALTPRGREGTVDLTVTNPDATTATLTGAFTYLAEPRIKRVTPQEGPAEGGTAVTITGSGYTPDAVVLFGDTPATHTTMVPTETSSEAGLEDD